MSESALAPGGFVEFLDFHKRCGRDRQDQHLCDPHSTLHDKIGLAEIDQRHLHLAAIIRVNRSRRVHQCNSMSTGQPTSRPHLRLVAGRQCHRETARDKAYFTRFKGLIGQYSRMQVKTRRVFGHPHGQRQAGGIFEPLYLYRYRARHLGFSIERRLDRRGERLPERWRLRQI